MNFFHIGMKAWAWEVIICFVVCFWTTYFCWCHSALMDYLIHSLFSDYIFWWEHGDWSHGNGSSGRAWRGMVMGAIFFYYLFQKNLRHWNFFHIGMKTWAWEVIICLVVCFCTTYFCWCQSVLMDYLIHSHFSDYIFWWEPWGRELWQREQWWRELFCSLFSDYIFLLVPESWYHFLLIHLLQRFECLLGGIIFFWSLSLNFMITICVLVHNMIPHSLWLPISQ